MLNWYSLIPKSSENMASDQGSKVPSGIKGLDAILDGGFPTGRVVLILGEPGTGKTILSSQFLFNGATKENKSMFVGMNESKSRYMSEMKDLGMDFEKLEKDAEFSYIDTSEVRRIPDQARVGRIPVGGRELGLVNLIDTIEEAIQRDSPKRIAIDSISDLVFRYPKIEERRPVVLDLVETLQTSKATCLMTSELLSTGVDRTLQPEEYLAEGVLLLRTVQKGARSIQVLKMRGSKIDTKPRPYMIAENGLEVYPNEEIY
jgi:KaiC/GvpD/RAD55 family RecA-like ATPase